MGSSRGAAYAFSAVAAAWAQGGQSALLSQSLPDHPQHEAVREHSLACCG